MGAWRVAPAAAVLLLTACGQREPADAPPAATPPTDAQKAALVAALPAPYNSGDVMHGRTVFARCRSCHSIVAGGEDMTGPNLHGIVGRTIGSKPGYPYSAALKSAGWTWDAPRLDRWLQNPRADIPTTKMTFFGLPDPKDRIDVIAYLQSESGKPAP